MRLEISSNDLEGLIGVLTQSPCLRYAIVHSLPRYIFAILVVGSLSCLAVVIIVQGSVVHQVRLFEIMNGSGFQEGS